MITFKSKLPLSKEEISRFLFLEITGKRNDEEYIKFSEKCQRAYGSLESLVKIGKGLLCTWGRPRKINIYHLREGTKTWEESLDYVYSELSSLPPQYFRDSIGIGSFGLVLPVSPEKIEKVNYAPFTPEEKKFYEYLRKSPVSVFPKVYTLGKSRVVMERIETKNIPEIKEMISKYIKRDSSKLLPVYTPDYPKIYHDLGKDHWFPKFLEEIEDGLEKIFGYRTIGDLTPRNIGVRKKTGEYVFFDPVGGDILK